MKVLIVGAGIAGPTLAYWLRRSGHDPVLLESAPELRRGGYLVDFWGAGFEVADRMGIADRVQAAGYRMREVREVDERGRRILSLDPVKLIGRHGAHYVSVGRSDLSRIIIDALPDDVQQVFGDTVEELRDEGDHVAVRFAHGGDQHFDLVVGADGLHSAVRRLAFGPESEYECSLGIAVAVFDVAGYRPRDELVAVMRTQVGAQTLRLSLDDDVSMFVFTFRHEGQIPLDDVDAQKALLRDRLGGLGWEVPAILATLPRAHLLLRLRQPDPDAVVESRTDRPGRRCRRGAVAVGRAGHGVGDDRGVRPGGGAGCGQGRPRPGIRRIPGAAGRVHRFQAARCDPDGRRIRAAYSSAATAAEHGDAADDAARSA